MQKSLVGVNIEGLYYWNRAQMFSDVIKTAQNIYNAPTDSNGCPLGDTDFLLFNNSVSVSGVYKFSCTGKCDLGFYASIPSTPLVQNYKYDSATNKTTADIIISQDNSQLDQVDLRIMNTTSGVKDIQMLRPGCDGSTLYSPQFIKAVQPFGFLRLMPAFATNGNQEKTWSDRALPTTAILTKGSGLPYEYAFKMAEETGKDIWINVPCGVDDNYFTELAKLTKQLLPSGINCFVEYSNEIWNYDFPEWMENYNAAQADVKNGDTTLTLGGTATDVNQVAWRRVAKQIAKISNAFKQVYGNVPNYPIRPVLAAQWAWPDIVGIQLDYLNRYYSPVSGTIYAIAEAPYMTIDWNVTTNPSGTVDMYLQSLGSGAINSNDSYTQKWHGYAKQYGVKSIAYEGGPDLGQANINVPQKIASQKDPRMSGIITQYLDNWFNGGGNLFGYFTLTSLYNFNGYWGATDDINDLSQPKIQALINAAKKYQYTDVQVPTPPITPVPINQPSPPPPPPPVPLPAINLGNLMLVDSYAQQDIGIIKDGTYFYNVPRNNLNIRFDPASGITGTNWTFTLDNSYFINNQQKYPYYMFGTDWHGVIFGGNIPDGYHVVSVSGLQGTLTQTFNLKNG